MNRSTCYVLVLLSLWIACTAPGAESNPYVGRWALTIPGGGMAGRYAGEGLP